jgi:PAS domain S-box-containing protein
VRRIVEDADGTLWFCSDTWLNPDTPSGLASYRQGIWRVYRQYDGLPSDYVSDYFRDSGGRQYALSRDGLAVRDGGRWHQPLKASDYPDHDQYFWSITESPSYGVLTTVEDAVFAFRDGKWSRFENARAELHHLKLAVLDDGTIVTLSGGYDAPKQFEAWTGSGFVALTEKFHVPGEATYVTAAPDGSVWAVGYDLLVRWGRSSGEWAEYPSLPAPMLVDEQGRVWFVGDDEIIRVTDRNRWESIPCAVHRIDCGRDSEVLGLTATTVFRFINDDIVSYGPTQTSVYEICGHVLDSRDRSWLYGTDENGRNILSVLDGDSWRNRSPPEIRGGHFRSCAPDSESGVYCLILPEPGREPRLVHITEDEINTISLPDPMRESELSLHVDHTGCPWISGHFGLFTFAEGSWRRIENIPGERVFGALNGDDETWFAYDGTSGGRTGLGRFKSGEWSCFDLDMRLRACGRGPNGAVFFGSQGIVYAAGGDTGPGPVPLTLPVDRVVYRTVQSSAGDVWIGVGDGVLRYRPDGVPPETMIRISDRTVQEGKSLPVAFEAVERFHPLGKSTIGFSWRIAPQPWTEFGPAQPEGLAGTLGPGRYTLEVRARDQGGDIDATPARMQFRVAALPLSQRRWFWPLATAVVVGLALLGGVAVVARYRTKGQAIRLEQVVDERTAKLRESEARFRAMTAAAPIPILIGRESDSTVLYANSLMAETLGIPVDELIGRRAQEFFGGPECETMLGEVQRVGYAQGHELFTRKADGTRLWCLVSLQKMTYDGQPALIGGLHDITEQKHTAEELERARQAAEVASRAKSVLLANLTHEVRTPVMAMLGAAEVYSERPGSAGGEMDSAEIISRNGRYLLSLFDNLLDVARMESGKFAVRPVECSLVDILSDVRTVAHLPYHKTSVEFRVFCEGSVPRRIRTDPLRLKQAVINLVNNALKFTSEGYVHVRARMHVGNGEPALVIAVEDTGAGIPEADRERIFDAFEQVQPCPGCLSVGVGLGLPLARSIARELGGTLELESVEGRGSTFTLRVPTGPVDAVEWVSPGELGAPPDASDSDPPAPSRSQVAGSVLLAEDARDAQALIAHALRDAGATVTAVDNGKEAVKAATDKAYDLILMDIRMPVMDGTAAMLELRRSGCLAPIIATTASVTGDQRRRIIERGFDDLWIKPMSLGQIVERASDYLRGPSPHDGNRSSGSHGAASARRAALVAEFTHDLPARLQRIEAAVDRGDLRTAREILHQLAGTGGMMGFMPLSEQAGRVLSRIKAGGVAGTRHELRALETVVDEIADGTSINRKADTDPHGRTRSADEVRASGAPSSMPQRG